MFNQLPWRQGTPNDAGICERCQCFGHATQCRYNPLVDKEKTSIDINGIYRGGGVCLNCTVILKSDLCDESILQEI